MRPAAWVAQAASDAARVRMRGLPSDRARLTELARELRHHRRVLANIGGNLNALAAYAHSTRELATERARLGAVIGAVRRMVDQSESQMRAVREVLG
jgi:hypothetical protein